MNEGYLWDRSGEPEPEVARLEQLLGRLRRPEPALKRAKSQPWLRERPWWWTLAAAAAIVLYFAAAFFVQRMHLLQPMTSWKLSFADQKPSRVRAGQRIDTVGRSRAIIQSDLVGRVDIEPDSRVRLVAAHEDEQRLALDHGTIHAFIWAPPTQFVVDTPSAKTVDLGCKYTLSVAKDGTGFLTVEMGWVAFQWRNVESFIPAGAACTTRPGRGPDTPHFLDAPEALTKAVANFDLTGNTQALNLALSTARRRDALTLWHLLQRTRGTERAEVFDRFQTLVKLPPSVTRQAVLSGDTKSMDTAWDALDLGNTDWWRGWKRRW
jgi:hypothetical protein